MRAMPLFVVNRLLAVAVFALCVGSPAGAQLNDDCAAATVSLSLPFVQTADTSTATTGGGDPFPSCAGNDANVWCTSSRRRATRASSAIAPGVRALAWEGFVRQRDGAT